MKKTIKFILILSFLFNSNLFGSFIKAEEHVERQNEYSHKKLLNQIPSRKGTVGVILVYKKDDRLYALLGKENNEGNSEKSGRYSDFGGSVSHDGTTFLENMLRELEEESIQTYKISQEDLLKNAFVFHTEKKDRDIFYAVYLINNSQYMPASILNHKRSSLGDKISQEYKEKEEFLWIDINLLLPAVKKHPQRETFAVKDIEGQTHLIKLRKYFIDDCLLQSVFENIIISYTH
ncbi:hypothetical protein IM40_06440 [Candidatus Paracaedimonas acanthamoebae]|nr:hypothetical protein IM40_06440 [Candidatus Paracaedimonas acanthamoebae]